MINTSLKNRLVIALVLLTGLGISIIAKDQAYFHGDGARDLIIISRIHQGGYLPQVGHENILGRNVPLYYYLLYLVSIFFGTSYIRIQWFFIIWGLLGVFLFLKILEEFHVDYKGRLLFALAFLLSLSVVRIMTEIWSVNLVFTLSLWAIYLIVKAVNKNSLIYAISSFFILAIAVAIDLSVLILFPFTLFWTLQLETSVKKKMYTFFIALLLLSLFFIWYLRVNSLVYGGIQNYLSHIGSVTASNPPEGTLSFLGQSKYLLLDTIWVDQRISLMGYIFDFYVFSLGIWILVVSLFVFYIYSQLKKKFFDKTLLILASLIAGTIIQLVTFYLLSKRIYFHYFTSIIFVPGAIIALVWNKSKNAVKILITIYLIIFMSTSVIKYANKKYGLNYFHRCLQTANVIKQISNGQPFGILYIDRAGLGTWETARFLYCLEYIGTVNSITALEGALMGENSRDNYDIRQEVSHLPTVTFLVCEGKDIKSCHKKMSEQYPYYQLLHIRNLEEYDIIVLTYVLSS